MESGKKLERTALVSLTLSMLTQLDARIAFPSYNFIMALWALFCCYARSSRAVFALLMFLGLSVICDVVFLSLWSSDNSNILLLRDGSSAAMTSEFSVTMMAFNVITKAAVAWYALKYYATLPKDQSTTH